MSHCILLVEDNDPLRKATLAVLHREGFEARGVASAEDVDDLPGGFVPQVYLLDLNLPGEDGLSLAMRIRKAQPQAAIVMMTTRSEVQDRIAGYESGADIYLPKPVDPTEMLACVRALCARLQSTVVKPQSGVLQLHTQILQLSGPLETVNLSLTEVRLLSHLARAADQTLEHWQIMEVCMQQSEDATAVTKASMEQRITRLRKKLEQASGEASGIKAIRSTGYKLTLALRVD